MNVGDPVEDFELPDEAGTPRRLSTTLRDGPVVLFSKKRSDRHADEALRIVTTAAG